MYTCWWSSLVWSTNNPWSSLYQASFTQCKTCCGQLWAWYGISIANTFTPNTGIEQRQKHTRYDVLVNVCNVKQLHEWSVTDTHLIIGAAFTLTQFDTLCERLIDEMPGMQFIHNTKVNPCRTQNTCIDWNSQHPTSICWITYTQHSGKCAHQHEHTLVLQSIVGNLITASPIADLNPIWLAIGAAVCVTSFDAKAVREVPIDDRFFPGYRRTVLKSDEVVTAMKIPFTSKVRYTYSSPFTPNT